jgi:Ca2+-binding RTX toxin-like protein
VRSARAAIGIAVVLALVPALGTSANAASGSNVGLMRFAGDLDEMSDHSRYGYVLLNAWDHEQIAELKAANPAVKVLVYKDMAACKYSTGRDDAGNTFYSVGVGCQQVNDGHTQWYLESTAGNRVEWCDYPGNWFMDVGSTSYQNAWKANVLADMETYGWDGVLVDDTMYSPRYHLCGRTLQKYPNDESFAAATESFLANVGPFVTSRGHLFIPNISDANPTTVFARWVGYGSGAMNEWWVADNNGVRSDADWSYGQKYLQVTEAQGKEFLGVTYGSADNARLMRYARASFLLETNGRGGALIYHAGTGIDPWSDDWTLNVGEPDGPKYKVGRAWRRDFAHGTVLVNPSGDDSVTVNLGGTYRRADGGQVSSVTLNPATGMVLRSVDTPPEPKVCTVTGTEEDDHLLGTPGDDVICALGGKDTIDAGDGNDTVYGNDGNDLLRGGLGNDLLSAGAGDDAVFGDDGDDELDGSAGVDLLSGGPGNDRLAGGTGANRMLGDSGVDELMGSTGRDVANGGAGRDRIVGGPGLNRLAGREGPDVLVGGVVRDLIFGGTGRDSIQGRGGRDRLFVRDGIRDVGHGGSGRDACHVDRGDNLRSCG